ncbi:MAG: molybdopterin converting factor subunit 1 [Pseudomonadota bacterium]
MTVLYFAWFRERIGVPKEEVETKATTVAELIDDLRARDDRHAAAFADLEGIKVAVNQKVQPFDASLAGAQEVAFFPPMTGG